MHWAVVWLAMLVLLGGGGSEPPLPSELLSGYSHGFARVVRMTCDGRRVQFLDGPRIALDLPPKVAAKWEEYAADLQYCYLSRPRLTVKNGRGVPATIYRFEGGIIVAWAKGTFALSTNIVMQWESQGGYKGPKGFPLTDTIPLVRPPKPKLRSVFAWPLPLTQGAFLLRAFFRLRRQCGILWL